MKRWICAALMVIWVLAASGCQRQPEGPAQSGPTAEPSTAPTSVPTVPTEPTETTEPPVTGWQEEGGRRYYYDEDGTMVTGWREIEEKLYYFDEDGSMYIGWLQTGDATYYLDMDGAACTGWVDIGDYTYYFREDGAMHTGWREEEGRRFFFLEDGPIAQGWADIDGQRYYFGGDGTMYTGWLYRGEYAYYLGSDGAAAVGPTQIDGETYYFSPSGVHIILVNPWNYLPDGYETELVTTERGLEVSIQCYDALEQMFDACRDAGCDPVLLSANRSWATQERLYNNNVQKYLDWGYGYERARELAGRSVAVPGTSEHQLGLAVDIVDNSNWSLDESQERTETQKWLMEHCWEYGFILRYPNDTTEITGIIYEPWHYRYVGVEIAMELRDLGITLEEYLGAA